MNKALLSEYSMKGKMYKIEHESMHMICFFCGKYDNYMKGCDVKAKLDMERIREGGEGTIVREMEAFEPKLVYG